MRTMTMHFERVFAVTDAVTWILTADDWNAQIHVSRDGNSTLLHTLRNRNPERMVRPAESMTTDFAALCIAAGIDTPRPRDTHLCFAHELLWLLNESSTQFDDLIIMATDEMMEALHAIGTQGFRARVMPK